MLLYWLKPKQDVWFLLRKKCLKKENLHLGNPALKFLINCKLIKQWKLISDKFSSIHLSTAHKVHLKTTEPNSLLFPSPPVCTIMLCMKRDNRASMLKDKNLKTKRGLQESCVCSQNSPWKHKEGACALLEPQAQLLLGLFSLICWSCLEENRMNSLQSKQVFRKAENAESYSK